MKKRTQALKKLVKWAKSEGYERIITNSKGVSQIKWKPNTLNLPYEISIEGRHSVEMKVYFLLHELGHHQMRKDWLEFEKRFPLVAKAEVEYLKGNINPKRRLSYKVSCMEEEFHAWDEGELLAESLGIRLNKDNFDKLKFKCLMSYIRYYGKNF